MHGEVDGLRGVDGVVPSPDALSDAQDYIDGRRTLDEILDDVRRRHTRRPKEEDDGR